MGIATIGLLHTHTHTNTKHVHHNVHLYGLVLAGTQMSSTNVTTSSSEFYARTHTHTGTCE